ncbi:mycoredoxin [Bailinhaonella thermotolerans]|uniref:Mycoredoxin n=1 Tax=Bailinhaonella thermotolerans TaxID=1070861 RepID=A0A3A4B0P9_9ACTN|nr:mycoredoxin [Bailinhaonella thermotolerans]RJL33508.1 mycoredoxin [Bailinhaonella thermotolerans]
MSALTVYTTSWCGPCRRLKTQLTREGIAFEEIDIERHPDAASFVESVNNGNQMVPTVVVETPAGRTVLTNPPVAQVKRLLEAAPQPQS